MSTLKDNIGRSQNVNPDEVTFGGSAPDKHVSYILRRPGHLCSTAPLHSTYLTFNKNIAPSCDLGFHTLIYNLNYIRTGEWAVFGRGLPAQVFEEDLHCVVVGFWQLLD